MSSEQPLIRIAATGDWHIRHQDDARFDEALAGLEGVADVLLMAGDLTEMGRVSEMQWAAEILQRSPVPVFAVLGNHDRRGLRRRAQRLALEDAGVTLLESSHAVLEMASGFRLTVIGITGTGGGFREGGEEFGPGARFTRAVTIKSRKESARLRKQLRDARELQTDATILLTHFSPTTSTLGTEPPLKYWMLGNALLGRTIDARPPAVVFHGHSHLGNEVGATPGGVPVRNVALPVIHGICLYGLSRDGAISSLGVLPIMAPEPVGSVRESDVL